MVPGWKETVNDVLTSEEARGGSQDKVTWTVEDSNMGTIVTSLRSVGISWVSGDAENSKNIFF